MPHTSQRSRKEVAMIPLQSTVTGRAGQTSDGGDVASLGDRVGAAELVEDGAVSHREGARVVVAVGDAGAAEGA